MLGQMTNHREREVSSFLASTSVKQAFHARSVRSPLALQVPKDSETRRVAVGKFNANLRNLSAGRREIRN